MQNDFWACVAAGAVIDLKNGEMNFGYICDSGIRVFGDKRKGVIKTENGGPESKKGKNKDMRERFGFVVNFRYPYIRKIERMGYRNPLNPYSYSILTGETEIGPSHMLLAYTDSFEEVAKSHKLSEIIWKRNFSSIRKLCREEVKTEGTLVYWFL